LRSRATSARKSCSSSSQVLSTARRRTAPHG
jgi:hypothetical protein